MRFFAVGILLVAAGCGPAISITRDASVAIYPRTTYAWGRADGTPTAAELDPRAGNDSVRARIERAVDYELQRRGFTKAEFRDAQLIVHYHIGVRARVDTLPPDQVGPCNTIPCPAPRYDWGYWGTPERVARAVAYEEGSLMLDFITRPSMTLAWRGSAKAEVTPSSASEARIRRGVAALLKRFPGKS